jgi:predicted metalloenzyme YecM
MSLMPPKLIEEIELFSAMIREQLIANNLKLPKHWSIDHLCYRVESFSDYTAKKDYFSKFSQLLIESDVNGRPISTFKLNKPIPFLNRRVDLIELPAPKEGKQVKEGFEHIEVVCDKDSHSIIEQYPQLQFKDNQQKKDFNSELQVKLEGCTIKFHALSLESVIHLEKNPTVFSALTKSQVLKKLKDYSPLVAGTFPLDIFTRDSDLDILICHIDTAKAKQLFDDHFNNFENYESHVGHDNGKDYALARFTFEAVPFELYAEATPTIEQRAYKHFQIEERFLKLGGPQFKKKIKQLRAEGVKTEPAFAKALELKGDPYLKLLELHGNSDEELLAFF